MSERTIRNRLFIARLAQAWLDAETPEEDGAKKLADLPDLDRYRLENKAAVTLGVLAHAGLEVRNRPVPNAGKILFRERRIAQFTEGARLHRLQGREDLAAQLEAIIEQDKHALEMLRGAMPDDPRSVRIACKVERTTKQ